MSDQAESAVELGEARRDLTRLMVGLAQTRSVGKGVEIISTRIPSILITLKRHPDCVRINFRIELGRIEALRELDHLRRVGDRLREKYHTFRQLLGGLVMRSESHEGAREFGKGRFVEGGLSEEYFRQLWILCPPMRHDAAHESGRSFSPTTRREAGCSNFNNLREEPAQLCFGTLLVRRSRFVGRGYTIHGAHNDNSGVDAHIDLRKA